MPPRSRAAARPPGRPCAPSPVAAGVLVLTVACGAGPAGPGASPAAGALAPPAATVQSAAVTPPCDPVPGWSCEQSARFAAVERELDGLPGADGHLAVSFTDRATGRTWTAGDVARPGWTASTIKLAIAADLLERDRSGRVQLTAADRHDMAAMLHSSDNKATDRLWDRHGGDDMPARFRDRYGMAGLAFQPGFSAGTYWGFVKCTTSDLASLARHVLDRTDPADRAYLVAAMRGVAPNQRWGVWAAGPGQRPGTKNGWLQERDPYGEHWVTDTVGFAGPDERHVVAIMYQLPPSGTLDDGVHAVSDVAALLFGAPIPAPVTIPDPD